MKNPHQVEHVGAKHNQVLAALRDGPPCLVPRTSNTVPISPCSCTNFHACRTNGKRGK